MVLKLSYQTLRPFEEESDRLANNLLLVGYAPTSVPKQKIHAQYIHL